MDTISEVLQAFEGLVVGHTVIKNDQGENATYYYKLVVKLKDTSLLSIEERMNRLGYQYSYHWMQADNTLLIRWDNAPHHPEVETHPYHQHVGSRQNVQPSEAMNLQKVLAWIAKTIVAALVAVAMWQILS